jgi:hypothetical protein
MDAADPVCDGRRLSPEFDSISRWRPWLDAFFDEKPTWIAAGREQEIDHIPWEVKRGDLAFPSAFTGGEDLLCCLG